MAMADICQEDGVLLVHGGAARILSRTRTPPADCLR